jgi:hypothetical protein
MTDGPDIVTAEAELDSKKALLLNLAQEICEKYQFKSRGRQRTQAVIAMLASDPCERSIQFKLANTGAKDWTSFDPWYQSKSDLATSFILSSIVGRVSAEGYSVGVATETRDAIGTYDITIQKGAQGAPCMIFRGSDLLCRLEVKGSWGLPLAEIARYMLNPSPLVLCRVMPGTATLLEPAEQEEFVRFMAGLLASKAERVIHGPAYTIPGPPCGDCRDLLCSFNKYAGPRKGRVTMREGEFGEDANTFLRNLPHICNASALLVLDVLERGGPA